MRGSADFIEFHFNQNKYLVLQQMFQGSYRPTVQAEGIVVDKSEYVIVLENDEWKVYPLNNPELCTNINIANWWMATHRRVQIIRDLIHDNWGYIVLYDDDHRCVKQFSLYQIDVRNGSNNCYLVPLGVNIEEREIHRGPEMPRERGNIIMITNNINDFNITTSGELIIDTDGIIFKEAGGRKWNRIATTKDMINIYGNESIRRLWNYINSPSENISETFVKEQIKKILTEGGEH